MINTNAILAQLAQSKAIWGILILLLNSTILKDHQITEAMGAEVAANVNVALTAIGSLLAVWGRLTANGPMISAPAS